MAKFSPVNNGRYNGNQWVYCIAEVSGRTTLSILYDSSQKIIAVYRPENPHLDHPDMQFFLPAFGADDLRYIDNTFARLAQSGGPRRLQKLEALLNLSNI
jgi:hypothetical protein